MGENFSKEEDANPNPFFSTCSASEGWGPVAAFVLCAAVHSHTDISKLVCTIDAEFCSRLSYAFAEWPKSEILNYNPSIYLIIV